MKNIYVGSHQRNLKTMIVHKQQYHAHVTNLANAPMSRGLYLATIQNNNKCIKSNLMLCKCTAVGKKDDVAQVEKTPACWESRVSKKSLLQFRGCAIITWRGGGGGVGWGMGEISPKTKS